MKVISPEQTHERTDGARLAASEPLRRCIVSRSSHPTENLLRFVLDPDGKLVPDLKRRLPGRGAWVLASKSAISEAIKTKAFPRAFGKPVSIPDELPDLIDGLLSQSTLQYLSLAKKAGTAILGFTKVADALRKNKVAALIHAQEAGSDGTQKLDRLYLALQQNSDLGDKSLQKRKAHIVTCFTTSELSLALGRENVIHAALVDGGTTQKFLTSVENLLIFRNGHNTEGPKEPILLTNAETITSGGPKTEKI